MKKSKFTGKMNLHKRRFRRTREERIRRHRKSQLVARQQHRCVPFLLIALGCLALFSVIFTYSLHHDPTDHIADPFAERCVDRMGIECSNPSFEFDTSRGQFTAALAGGGWPSRRGSRRRRGRRNAAEGQVVCYARFSSDEQDAKSIDDQLRACRRHAKRKNLKIDDLYKDEAISGTVRNRDGLNRLIADAEAGKIRVIYFFNLSRLARELLISQSVLRRLVEMYRIRVITVVENLDSDVDGWETIAAIFNVIHQEALRMLRENVRNGQIGTVEKGFSVGDWRFGYTSTPSPKGETIRRAGEDKPRMVYVIKEGEAEWVRKVFHWFVMEFREIQWIVRELNRLKVPKDHRATTPNWNHQLVVSLLRSIKYIGLWAWGELENIRDPDTGRVSQIERDEEECAPWRRERPDLRIISDEQFMEAQERLDENAAKLEAYRDEKGRLGGSDGSQRIQMLTGLMICPACGNKMYVVGAHGDYLQCCGARDGACDCTTMLPRRLAQRLILDSISQLVMQDPSWVDAVHHQAVQTWHELRRQQPNSVEELERQIQKMEKYIQTLLDELESSDQPDPDIRQRLRDRQRERDDLRRQLRQLVVQECQLPKPPTREWVVVQLQRLDEVLKGTAAAANNALLRLLGGPLQLEIITEEGRKRKFWRGRFRIHTLGFDHMPVTLTAKGSEVAEKNPEIIVDFRKLPREEEQILEGWRLLQQGYSFTEIATVLRAGKARATFILKLVARRYGNGLTAKQLKKQFDHLRPRRHAHDDYIEPAMALYDDGMLIDEIATRLKTNRKMIRNAINAGYATLGLEIPDGRSRRKSLKYKGRSAWNVRRRNASGDSPQAT